MRIAITGASGFVGQGLVPLLSANGMDLLLVGRDPAVLEQLFPGMQACRPEELGETGRGCEFVLHMAARNNDRPGTQEEFDAVNRDHALAVMEQARAAGIPRFVYVSSVNALDTGNRSAYAESKRRGEAALRAASGEMEVGVIYLPAVQGQRFAGRLAPLNRLTPGLRWLAFRALSALRPTVHAERLATYVMSGSPMGDEGRRILSDGQQGNPVYAVAMRVVDYAFALTILLGFWWVLLAAWVAVKRDSDGPGLFGQPRVGRYGRVFTCWKFRTMQVGTAQTGTHEVAVSSVTKVGSFLRRTKIDELPQVWNILRGEIALIGPRPCLPVQTKLIEEREKRGVLSVLPGISGLAQVEGIDMSDPVRLAQRDADYVALRGVIPDIRIILHTARGNGRGDRVKTA
jgi:lipopolysaccharide/colanic/teichoic acid biosynthesis glycosyltransferase